MEQFLQRFRSYIETHPLDTGDEEHPTVLDQLYQAYAESHESDPPEIRDGFKELEEFLCSLPLDDNNAVFNLCCRLCSAYEEKAFHDGGAVWGASYARTKTDKSHRLAHIRRDAVGSIN